MENPIKMDDLGVPLFSETSTYYLNKPPRFLMIFHHVILSRVDGQWLEPKAFNQLDATDIPKAVAISDVSNRNLLE